MTGHILQERRTHTCGDLRLEDRGGKVYLTGWIYRRRDHGGIVFLDLRDRWGITQITLDPTEIQEPSVPFDDLRPGSCVGIAGTVISREERGSKPNKALPTGDIEVLALRADLFSSTIPLPFALEEETDANELLRLKYRYLDLRRGPLLKNLALRSKITHEVRAYLHEQGFLDVETPILTKSTPEGARDYLVPSRLEAGQFYALPQSPQLYKQLLMIGGVERYYQIARCFRDEDLRADRQPEFTQIDLEMSFIQKSDIYATVEGFFARVFRAVFGIELVTPFPRLSYAYAMDTYGEDKPDLRYGLPLIDLASVFAQTSFRGFQLALQGGGVVKAIRIPGQAERPRSWIDGLEALAKQRGAKGMAWFKRQADGWQSPLTKFLTPEEIAAFQTATDSQPGDLVIVIADPDKDIVFTALSTLRRHLAKDLHLIDTSIWAPFWIEDFPMFLPDKATGRLELSHHPFTMPHHEDLHLLDTEPLRVRAQSYDIVLNGFELGSGSLRIYDSTLQKKIFQLVGLTDQEAEERFGFFLEALRFGTPPHGGIAVGLDRLTMLIAGEESLREVIAFPKTQRAACPMNGAPSTVAADQLRDIHIAVIPTESPQR